MLLRNKSFCVCALSLLVICSCKNSPETLSVPRKIPMLPENGTVTSESASFFRKTFDELGKNLNSVLQLSEDCVLEVQNGQYKLKKGTVTEITSPTKQKLKNIKYQTMLPSVTGSYSFFRMLIPKKFVPEDAKFNVKYLNGEKLQDSKEGNVYSYYENSHSDFYGVFLPFSPLYDADHYFLSIQMAFNDGEKIAVYSTGEIKKSTFKEQTLNFPKGKSGELASASRKLYNKQQAARHELWRTVTAPLTKDVLQIGKPLDNTLRLTSDFCFTRKWFLNTGQLYSRDIHLGVDYGVPTGTPVYSLLDGVVVSSELQELYGNMVIVDHGLGLYTNYCHMSKRLKNADTLIEKGETLGEVGMTGAATGPHLHVEARIYGIPIDYRKLEYLPELFVSE